MKGTKGKKPMIRMALLAAIAIGAVIVVATQLPDLVRYVRIKTM